VLSAAAVATLLIAPLLAHTMRTPPQPAAAPEPPAADPAADPAAAAADPAAERAPQPGADVAPAGTVWHDIRVDGVLRRYLLSVPGSRQGRVPLVVAFHGLRQQAAPFAEATGLVPATRAAGQILVLPESDGPAFNDGRLGRSGPRDDAFTMAVVDHLVRLGLADPARVVVTGFSNGAGMAMEVAAAHPRQISALVSVCGELIDAPGAPRPTGPVRAYLLHGTDDPVQPWPGRRARGPYLPAYVSEPATVAAWVTAGHGGGQTSREVPGEPGRDAVTVQSWAAGRSGAAVTFYVVHGMGHGWATAARNTVDATALVVRAATPAAEASSPGGI
jgi:poly(3-hydroxybutyrate) depolymerase